MEALLLQADPAGVGVFDYCLFFPDIEIMSTSGRDGQVFGTNDHAAKFWLKQTRVDKVNVPFHVVARLYCYYMDYRLAEFKRSDHELWADSQVKAAISKATKDYCKKQTSSQNA